MSERKKVVIGLAIIFFLEALLYSRSFSRFFCGDSLYFLSRRLTSSADVINAFTKIDYLEVYRPLTFILVTFMYPLFKLNAFGYHFVPLIFHILNTYLVFLLMRRLLKTDLGAYVAAFYFGVHSVNFFITYDISATPDFTYTFFYLLALLSFLRYMDTERKVWLAGCMLAFVLALLAKEAAITLLATALLAAIVYLEKRGGEEPIAKTLFYATKKAWPLFTVGAIYFTALLAIKGWSLYPQRIAHPHHAEFTLRSLMTKYKYLRWALNLPDDLMLRRRALPKLIVTAGLAPFIGILTLFIIRNILVKNRIVWYGLLWFVATLSPVLVMANITMAHNLYVPIIGLALIFGSLAETALPYLRPRRLAIAGAGTLFVFSIVIIAACWINIKSSMATSWLANGSVVAEAALEDLKNARLTLPADATLYFLRSTEKDLPWFFDYGSLFRIFYNNPSIKVLFADRGAKLPPDYLDNNKVIILRFVRPHLYDVTEEFKADMRDTISLKLMPLVGPRNVFFSKESVDYPRYDIFETPTGMPVFNLYLGRAGTVREVVVTIAGAQVRLDIPPIEDHTQLVFGVTMVFLDVGDGAEGRVYFEYEGRRDLLYSRLLTPAQKQSDRRWFDEAIDLSRYAGKKGCLIFECGPGPSRNTVADWLAWSGMKIVRSYDSHMNTAHLPKPTYIRFNPTSTRLGEYVIVTVGNGSYMSIDCRYTFNGVEKIKEKWSTANATGQFVFQPVEAGKWEVTAIKNSLSKDWVPVSATLIVQ